MEIKINESYDYFSSVKVGEVFKKGIYVYMKTEEFFSEVDHYNCICLNDGSMCYLSDNSDIDKTFKKIILE